MWDARECADWIREQAAAIQGPRNDQTDRKRMRRTTPQQD